MPAKSVISSDSTSVSRAISPACSPARTSNSAAVSSAPRQPASAASTLCVKCSSVQATTSKERPSPSPDSAMWPGGQRQKPRNSAPKSSPSVVPTATFTTPKASAERKSTTCSNCVPPAMTLWPPMPRNSPVLNSSRANVRGKSRSTWPCPAPHKTNSTATTHNTSLTTACSA